MTLTKAERDELRARSMAGTDVDAFGVTPRFRASEVRALLDALDRAEATIAILRQDVEACRTSAAFVAEIVKARKAGP